MTRESEMLRLRDVEHLTLREIGERYGITAERVRQIVNRYRHSLQNPSPASVRRGAPPGSPHERQGPPGRPLP